MDANKNPRYRPLSYEVRVKGLYSNGNAFNTARSRAAKIDTAILAVIEVARLWAVQNGNVMPGTTVSLINLHDGAEVMTLRWNGFDESTLDAALEALRDNGFQLEEVTQNGE